MSEGLKTCLDQIAQRLGGRLTVNQSVRQAHGRGEAFHRDAPPDAVAFPNNTEEVSAIVRSCAAHGIPVIPYGAGTSLEGNVTAPAGGVAIDMSEMNAVLTVNESDLDCVVQPGVTREALNAYLRDSGLFFPIDPGANATLGGMASTRASGTNAVRYGTMRDNVLFLRVVLADGTEIRTARRARKSSAGYDLTALFVGAEGTLGIITEIGLKLYGRPEATAVAICTFPSVRHAVQTVVESIQLGIPVARVELLDPVQVRAINSYCNMSLHERPTLMFEFHGSEASVREQSTLVQSISESNAATGFNWAVEAEERSALWKARHNAYFAAQALRPGSQLIVTDVCVPISALPDCIEATQQDMLEAGVVAPIVGHVGDGNFHVFFTVDPGSADEIAVVRALNERLVNRALLADGTCTGEHGIGVGKQDKLVDELGETAVDLMRSIKRALDPQALFNPGKIFAASKPMVT